MHEAHYLFEYGASCFLDDSFVGIGTMGNWPSRGSISWIDGVGAKLLGQTWKCVIFGRRKLCFIIEIGKCYFCML